MYLTLKNRGIRWRDTHYPLDERANWKWFDDKRE
jgi:hypothetical protein